jgi:carbon-monoxide dehydrogenase large subunit
MTVEPALRDRLRPLLRDELTPVLPEARVAYVGQPVALVVAASRAQAEDAAELLEIEYEPLPAVVSAEQGLRPDAPRVHPHWGDNLAVHFITGHGEVDAAFAMASVVVRERFVFHRQGAVPIESRAILAEPERQGEGLHVWSSTQVPHAQRRSLAACLGLPEERLRVTAPDVGGGFGPKSLVYPEDVLVALVARRLGRPVKFAADRREDLAASAQSRGQTMEVSIAAALDGRLLALDVRLIVDCGAFNPWQWNMAYNTAVHLAGPYRIPSLRVEVTYVATNKAPLISIRGAGRPEAAFAMERGLDRVAAALEQDPILARRRNLLRPADLPWNSGLLYKDGQPLYLDGGDFPTALERTLQAIGHTDFRPEQKAALAGGRWLGLGVAGYVEGTGQGPFESARVRVDPSGTVICDVGAAPQGQGHQTVYAQIVAAQLDLDPTVVEVRTGDTGLLAFGVGTYASRSAVTAGNAAAQAASQVRERALWLAARAFEVSPADLEWHDGRVAVRGSPSQTLGLSQLAALAAPHRLPPQLGIDPGLEATAYYQPDTVTFSGGFHAAVVEVDPETGQVKVLRYAVVHDCGRAINPLLVDGQVAGGVVHGLGAALQEEVVVDQDGQLLTASLMDYLIPTAPDVPPLRLLEQEAPSARNPLGLKGVGEGGTVPVPAVIASAVEDALRPLGVVIREVPVSPARLWCWIRDHREPPSTL